MGGGCGTGITATQEIGMKYQGKGSSLYRLGTNNGSWCLTGISAALSNLRYPTGVVPVTQKEQQL